MAQRGHAAIGRRTVQTVNFVPEVLPITAAKRMGIKRVIVPSRNKKDLEEIPKYIKKDMEFVFAGDMDQVLKVALIPEKKKTKSGAKQKK